MGERLLLKERLSGRSFSEEVLEGRWFVEEPLVGKVFLERTSVGRWSTDRPSKSSASVPSGVIIERLLPEEKLVGRSFSEEHRSVEKGTTEHAPASRHFRFADHTHVSIRDFLMKPCYTQDDWKPFQTTTKPRAH